MLIGIVLLSRASTRPSQKTIDVPFTTQAPEGNWSEPWKNACEETSIYMVSRFYQDDPIKREEAVKHIKEIFKVKNKEFQVSYDESLETIAALIKELGFPWSTRLVADPTAEMLKMELAQNHPIIVPVFAPALWGPDFAGDGPDYHVLVLIGYDDAAGEFIVNDPGTVSGESKRFPYDKFMNAIHDLNAKDYRAGKKAVLFTQESDWTGWMDIFNPSTGS